ncbi:MAG: MOSC domain-containing protein [Acidobacteriota bacterium]|nr:MOSC domain-containing protein [Acidobacteriota bacterium]
MNVSELNIYPIKSLGGISLKSSIVEERGLQFDRRWLLVDDKNHFLTQREFPQMARFTIELGNEELNIKFEGNNLTIPFQANSEESGNVKIWSSRVKTKFCADEINEWFSENLQTKCRLVVMTKESKRIVEPFYAVRKFKDTVSFADAYPYLLIGTDSLTDLNGKLEKPLPMNRFRPNFVISGSEAFAEDSWKKIKIGDTIFHVVKNCARCVITTIDQEKGAKNGAEPLATLAKYRNKNGKVSFGRYMIVMPQ